MKILDRYIVTAVVGGTGISLAVLVPLLGFFMLAEEMDQVGENGYRFVDAVLVVLFSMPRFGYQLFPIATLIGALIGLGLLASRSELVAMRAAGVAISRIVAAALIGGVLLSLGAVAIGEGLAPFAEQQAIALRGKAQTDKPTLRTRHGLWARDGQSFIHISDILPGSTLGKIHLYILDDDLRLKSATYALEARYVDGRWRLEYISRSQIGDDRVQRQFARTSEWESLLSPDLLAMIVVEPHALSIPNLLQYIRYMNENGQDPIGYEVVLWARFVHPFLIPAMIFLSIPILFASARSRGIGTRVFFGVLVGIGFYLVSRGFASFALFYGLHPSVAAAAPPTLFVLGALVVLRRTG